MSHDHGNARKFCLDVWQLGPTCPGHTQIEIFLHIAVFHVTRLRHESINHTVETYIVIGTRTRQFFHALAMKRGNIRQQFDDDCTIFEFHQNCVFWIFDLGHGALLCSYLPRYLRLFCLRDKPLRAIYKRCIENKNSWKWYKDMGWKTLDDMNLAGKRVLIRVDINVPMDGTTVTDATRIEKIVPTVRDVLSAGGRPILLAHFGRPKGQRNDDMSLRHLIPT